MSTIRHSSRQHGFAIAAAIFILVLLATLALAITMLTTQTSTEAARDTLGSRAYQAARAGLDWAAFQVLDPEGALTRYKDLHAADLCLFCSWYSRVSRMMLPTPVEEAGTW